MSVTIARTGVGQYHWQTAGTITTVQAALTTDKSSATVEALTSTGTIFIAPNDNTVSIDVRFRGLATDGDSNVINIYAVAEGQDDQYADHYTLITTATLTTGTQVYSTGNLFVDTIDNSAFEKWADDIVVVSDEANGIAHIEFNTHGHSKFLVIATTLNSSSLIVDWRRV